MSTESEVLLARYREVEREADELGRVIGVRRLRPSEQSRLTGLTPELPGYDEVDEVDPETKQPTGKKLQVPHRMPLQIAASVCEIDGVRIPFPRSRAELDSMYDRLDMEGITAAGKAFMRMIDKSATARSQEEVVEQAKNSSGIPGSE